MPEPSAARSVARVLVISPWEGARRRRTLYRATTKPVPAGLEADPKKKPVPGLAAGAGAGFGAAGLGADEAL